MQFPTASGIIQIEDRQSEFSFVPSLSEQKASYLQCPFCSKFVSMAHHDHYRTMLLHQQRDHLIEPTGPAIRFDMLVVRLLPRHAVPLIPSAPAPAMYWSSSYPRSKRATKVSVAKKPLGPEIVL